ncbi:MAG: hypothetical protein ABII12_18300 [Planctomycetota bacterium]
MSGGGRDLFEMWRWLLCVVCAVYAVVVTGRSLWGWYVYLSARDRTRMIMRKYVVVQLLRLRLRPLARELSLIGFWLILLALVLSRHAS